MKRELSKRVITTERIELSEEEIATIILRSIGKPNLPCNAVEFDCPSGFLRGATVTIIDETDTTS